MNTQRWQRHGNKLGIFTVAPLIVGMALMNANTTPASAQSAILINQRVPSEVNQSPPVSSYIYGSPIPTPVPVNPVTVHVSTSPYYSYPVAGTVVNPVLVNPVLVNPTIRNSTLINPVIVNDQFYRTPVLRRGIIFGYPY